jgi:hypothetical protein
MKLARNHSDSISVIEGLFEFVLTQEALELLQCGNVSNKSNSIIVVEGLFELVFTEETLELL